MKKLASTLCIVGTTLVLAACMSSANEGSYDSGSSYASERTAGKVDSAPVKTERVFRQSQSK